MLQLINAAQSTKFKRTINSARQFFEKEISQKPV
jgi:hypothetical protein